MIIHCQFKTNWGRILNRYILVVTPKFYKTHPDYVDAMVGEMNKRVAKIERRQARRGCRNKYLHQVVVWRKPAKWIIAHKDCRSNVLKLPF